MTDDFKKNLKAIVILLFIIGIIGYGLFQSRSLIAGPKITIFGPENGTALNRKFTEVRGRTENTSKITMNGRNILIDPEGDFREKILLSKGYNVFVIRALDRFGRETIEKLELVY